MEENDEILIIVSNSRIMNNFFIINFEDINSPNLISSLKIDYGLYSV